jgi:hypothetical protein
VMESGEADVGSRMIQCRKQSVLSHRLASE